MWYALVLLSLLTAGVPVYVWMRWQSTRSSLKPTIVTPDDAEVLDLTVADGG